MDRQQRDAALNQWKHAARSELLARMPLSPEQLHRLLDHLAANLEVCDHTTRRTATFLQVDQLDRDKTLSWLREQGGYCDCEILANLADLDDSLQAPPSVSRAGSRPKQKRAPRSLDSVTGWNLSNLTAPWRIANLYVPDEPLRIEFGKHGGCSIEIVESPLPAGEKSSDEYWTRLWFARTELPQKGVMQVNRGAMVLPEGFESTLVRSPSWVPVYCWVVLTTHSWHLEIKTEFGRCAGDFMQVSSLISGFVRNQE
jgi:hypothetical protein